ncbi:hypothetical protein [Micromonospora sp. NPDC047134]|uniref:hypothetical protein n=1 Tax=Micromonospora sp. NPDC047134 TaxID=3154340 RepID=UPI00340765E0
MAARAGRRERRRAATITSDLRPRFFIRALSGPARPGHLAAGNYDDPEHWRTPAMLLDQVILPASA